MTTAVYAIAVALLLLILGGLAWRRVSLHHSHPCPEWLHWLVEKDLPFINTYRTAVIIERLGLSAGMTALDAGCGPGRVTIPMALAVGPDGMVTALDVQEGMLARARRKAEGAGLGNIRFVHAGLGGGALGKGEYDRALLVTVLGEIAGREAALKEIYGSLKPGGVLSITEIILDPHFTPLANALKLAEDAGFKEKEFFGGRFAYTLNLEKPEGNEQAA